MDKIGFVHILASGPHGTLYVGVTSNLVQRVHQHRSGQTAGFTARHGVTRLVCFEAFDSIETAIFREKQLKKWRRQWKIELIERENPDWHDLWPGLAGDAA